MVTFKGAVGGVMSGDLLHANFLILREEALSKGKLPYEKLSSKESDPGSDMDLVAGLYVRALLYKDAEDLNICSVVEHG